VLVALLFALTSCGGSGDYGESFDSQTAVNSSESDKKSLDNFGIPSDSIFHVSRNGNELREHCVYYVDVTESMERNGLVNPVKSELINAIERCDEPNTFVEIILFTDKDGWNNNKRLWTWAGNIPEKKEEAVKFISEIQIAPMSDSPRQNNWTNHHIVLEDFMQNRLDGNYLNIMYLLTDGESNEDKEKVDNSFEILSKEASSKPYRYGFYVGLNDKALSSDLSGSFNEAGSHFKTIEGAKLGVNLFTFNLKNRILVDSIRQKPYIRIPYFGIAPDTMQIITNNIPVIVKNTTIDRNNKCIILEIRAKDLSSSLPNSMSFNLEFKNSWKDTLKLNFPDTISLPFTCSDAKEREIRVSGISSLVRDVEIDYYNRLWFWEASADTVWGAIRYELSSDAIKANSNIILRFSATKGILTVNEKGDTCTSFRLSSNTPNPIKIGFTVDPNSEIDKINECAVIFDVDSDLESLVVDNEVLLPNEAGQRQIRKTFNIHTKECINPFWWILGFIIASPFIALFICWMIRKNKPKFSPTSNIDFDVLAGPNDFRSPITPLRCGSYGRKKSILTTHCATINVVNISNECVECISILSNEADMKEDIFCLTRGRHLYVLADFNGCEYNGSIVDRIDIIPIKNNKCKIVIFHNGKIINDNGDNTLPLNQRQRCCYRVGDDGENICVYSIN